jgi:hypothetical protein
MKSWRMDYGVLKREVCRENKARDKETWKKLRVDG